MQIITFDRGDSRCLRSLLDWFPRQRIRPRGKPNRRLEDFLKRNVGSTWRRKAEDRPLLENIVRNVVAGLPTEIRTAYWYYWLLSAMSAFNVCDRLWWYPLWRLLIKFNPMLSTFWNVKRTEILYALYNYHPL